MSKWTSSNRKIIRELDLDKAEPRTRRKSEKPGSEQDEAAPGVDVDGWNARALSCAEQRVEVKRREPIQ